MLVSTDLLDALGLQGATNLLLALSYFRRNEQPIFDALLSQARPAAAAAVAAAAAAVASDVLFLMMPAASYSLATQRSEGSAAYYCHRGSLRCLLLLRVCAAACAVLLQLLRHVQCLSKEGVSQLQTVGLAFR